MKRCVFIAVFGLLSLPLFGNFVWAQTPHPLEVIIEWDLDDTLIFKRVEAIENYLTVQAVGGTYFVPKAAVATIELLHSQPLNGIRFVQGFYSTGHSERNHSVLSLIETNFGSLKNIAANILSRDSVFAFDDVRPGYRRAQADQRSSLNYFGGVYLKPLSMVSELHRERVLMIDDSLDYAAAGDEMNFIKFHFLERAKTASAIANGYARVLGLVLKAAEDLRDHNAPLGSTVKTQLWTTDANGDLKPKMIDSEVLKRGQLALCGSLLTGS